ncbi:MAG: hypothetical protein GY757_29000, partial [bacterium]|nr:hypothetical protein [bacterium]
MRTVAEKTGRWFLTLLTAIIAVVPIWGLDPAIDTDRYLIDKWTVKDGLPTDRIQCILQTPDNYLWIGTFNGLIRFDGVRMQKIDSGDDARTGDSYITKMHLDREGALWIGTYPGLTRYKDNRFNYFSQADGLPKKPILSICEDANGILLVSLYNDNIYRHNAGKDTFERFDTKKNFAHKQVVEMIQDSKGILWFSCMLEGLYKYINDSFVRVDIDLPGGNATSSSLYESSSGDLYVVTPKGLVLITREKTELVIPADYAISEIRATQILEDKDRNLWLAAPNGLKRITEPNTAKKQVQAILENESINCVFEDRENNLWVGTRTSGLLRLKNPLIKTYTTSDGLPHNRIYSLLEDRTGTIWVGTETQLCRYRNGKFETVPTLSLNNWFGLAEDKEGTIWACGINGILKNPGPNAVHVLRRSDKANLGVRTLFFDSKNRLWTGSHQGIKRLDNGRFQSLTAADGMPHDFATCIIEDKNNDILVLTTNGIIRFPKGELTMTATETTLPGISGAFISKDRDNPDVFWIGTYLDGLLRLSGDKTISYKKVPGLEGKQLYQGLEDEYGYLWLGSDKGIIRLKKKDLETYAPGSPDWLTPTVFTTKDGMLKDGCSYSSYNTILKTAGRKTAGQKTAGGETAGQKTAGGETAGGETAGGETAGGELWFATNKGICILDPAKIAINKQPPKVII